MLSITSSTPKITNLIKYRSPPSPNTQHDHIQLYTNSTTDLPADTSTPWTQLERIQRRSREANRGSTPHHHLTYAILDQQLMHVLVTETGQCNIPTPTKQHLECPITMWAHVWQNLADHYTLGKVLGRGQFGTTRLAIEKSTGDQYACKSISKRKLTCAPLLLPRLAQ